MKQLKKTVINRRNLPAKPPFTPTLVIALALDYWNIPQWACGAIVLLIVLVWIGAIIRICNDTEIDLFPDSKDTEKEEK